MMLKLASGRRLPATFTARHVLYGSGCILYRRDLGTLVEEHIGCFSSDISDVWTNHRGTLFVATFQLPDHMVQIWRQRGTEWEIHSTYIDMVAFVKLRRRVHQDGRCRIDIKDGILWLTVENRTFERARRLIKDEALVARLRSFLE